MTALNGGSSLICVHLRNLRTSNLDGITGPNQYVLLPCKPDFVPGGFPPQ